MFTTDTGVLHRHGLAVRHLPLVKALTLRARHRLPRAFEPEDLFGAGTIGLVEAGRRFDPTRGVTFGQFARPLISRAIADHVREGTAANRQHRRDTRAGRTPLTCQEVSVTEAVHTRDAALSPEAACIQGEQAALVRRAVDDLPRRLRAVIVRYYFRDKPGPPLSSPKASRLHKDAMARLRVALEQRGLSAECFI